MKYGHGIVATLLSLSAAGNAAGAWTFGDGSVSIQGKGTGVGGGVKEKLFPDAELGTALSLSPTDTLKVTLTAQEGKTPKKPSQAFLHLQDPVSGLEDSFAFSIKDNGKGKVEIAQKDVPFQLLTSISPVRASIIIAAFGSSTPYQQTAFQLAFASDPSAPVAVPSPPERYSSKPEIHHIFRADPKSPPKILSLVFTLAILAALPLILGTWLLLGGNVDHAATAFGANPVAHGLFFGSVVAMEGVFFLYYSHWNLFQTLPAMALVGVVMYVSGSRALTEVQERRLAGKR